MADFEPAFQRLMRDESISLTDHAKDRGGLAYAGITRKFHPKWEGWKYIDVGSTPPTQLVRDFYHVEYWMPIRGDQIKDQRIAEALFSQYVNMETTAIKLAQAVLGVVADGKIGPKTIDAINAYEPNRFLDRLCIAMVARYHAIGMRDKTQRVWWPGWISRALRIAP